MRLPYISNPPPTTNPTDAAIVAQTIARRSVTVVQERGEEPGGGGGLNELDLTLFHSFPIVDGWNGFYGSIRNRTSIGRDVLETAICRVAVLTRAEYEWHHHSPLAARAGVDVASVKSGGEGEGEGEGDGAGGILPQHLRAVIRYADAMTRDIEVPDPVFEELRRHFNDKEIVEITVTVAAYNCGSRILRALDVGERNQAKFLNVEDWPVPK